MDEGAITDLKQFIVAVVTQQTVDIRQDIQRLDAKVDRLDDDLQALGQKMDDGFAGVGDAIGILSDALQEQLDNHDQRLTHLEHKTA